MYLVSIKTTGDPVEDFTTDTLSDAVMFAVQSAREGDTVRIYECLDGLCGPEVQDLILEYVEDGWKSYDE